MDSIYKRRNKFIFCWFPHFYCNMFIGKKHKLFYQLMGFLRNLYVSSYWCAFVVKLKFNFRTFNIKCSTVQSFRTNNFSQCIKNINFFGKSIFFSFNNFLYFFIGESMVRMDNSFAKPCI